MTPQNKVHSSAYYLMMAIAVVVGIALGIGIFVWISMNATSRVRIPVYLLILPTILLVGLVRFIDGALVKRRQTSSGLGNQDMAPLASPYGQPDTSVEYGRPPQVGGPAPYGQAQQPMPGSSAGYGQAHGATAPAYGQAQQPVPGSGSGYGRPATGYSQTPQTDAQSPYGQNGSQIG